MAPAARAFGRLGRLPLRGAARVAGVAPVFRRCVVAAARGAVAERLVFCERD